MTATTFGGGRLTEGQLYTTAIAVTVTVAMALIGLPPVLRGNDRAAERPFGPRGTVAMPVVAGGPPAVIAPAASVTTRPGDPVDAGGTSAPGEPGVPTTIPDDPGPELPTFADGGAFGVIETLAAVREPGAPAGIAVDPATGGFWVATDNGGGRGGTGPSVLLRHSAAGTLEATLTVTGQPATRSYGLTAVVLDSHHQPIALDGATGRLLRFGADGTQSTLATLPDVGVCTPLVTTNCETSPTDSPPVPVAAAFDSNGDLFVSDTAQGIVWKVGPSGSLSTWLRSPELVSATDAGPAGLAFDGDGNLVLAVTSSLVAPTGAVYLVPVADDGTPGAPTELWGPPDAEPGDAPTGVALGSSGRVYVTLAGADALVVLEADGTEKARVPAAGSDGQAVVPLDGPWGIAFRGLSVLVTNRSSGSDPARWAVLRVSVEEAGLAP